MKMRIGILLLTVIGLSGCNYHNADIIMVSGRNILLNDSPYTIKGVCYNPVPVGSNHRSFDNLAEDLLLIKEAGMNTIRVYSPIEDVAVLDQIAESGLKVIIGIGYNQDGHFDMLSGSFIDYINTFRKHDAILFWELGNEYNYHPEWFDGDIQNWYRVLNESAELIHKADPGHPVSTAYGDLPDSSVLALCPNIDVWGLNVYRWDNPETVFSEWSARSSKPMYLSEAGADSYMTISRDAYEAGENEQAQADALQNILNDVFSFTDICSGITIFAFIDEWWKAGNPGSQEPGGRAPNSSGVPYDGSPNEEYWGIVDIQRNKKRAFEVAKTIFTEKATE